MRQKSRTSPCTEKFITPLVLTRISALQSARPVNQSAYATFRLLWSDSTWVIFPRRTRLRTTTTMDYTRTTFIENSFFQKRFDQNDVSHHDHIWAFSISLTENAFHYYSDNPRPNNFFFDGPVQAMNECFLNRKRNRALLREWASLSLTGVMSKNQTKPTSGWLDLLLSKLSLIRTSLPEEYLSDTIPRSKLVNFVRKQDDCRLSFHKPPNTIPGFISDFHASLATSKQTLPLRTGINSLDVNYVDRPYSRRMPTSHPKSRPGRD